MVLLLIVFVVAELVVSCELFELSASRVVKTGEMLKWFQEQWGHFSSEYSNTLRTRLYAARNVLNRINAHIHRYFHKHAHTYTRKQKEAPGQSFLVRATPNSEDISAFEVSQAAPQRFCANAVASENMNSIFVTLVTFHLEISVLKDFALLNILAISVTLATFQLEMSPLNAVASENMSAMLVTLDTFHLEISVLKDVAL